jgi:hypothetical protein
VFDASQFASLEAGMDESDVKITLDVEAAEQLEEGAEEAHDDELAVAVIRKQELAIDALLGKYEKKLKMNIKLSMVKSIRSMSREFQEEIHLRVRKRVRNTDGGVELDERTRVADMALKDQLSTIMSKTSTISAAASLMPSSVSSEEHSAGYERSKRAAALMAQKEARDLKAQKEENNRSAKMRKQQRRELKQKLRREMMWIKTKGVTGMDDIGESSDEDVSDSDHSMSTAAATEPRATEAHANVGPGWTSVAGDMADIAWKKIMTRERKQRQDKWKPMRVREGLKKMYMEVHGQRNSLF